LPLAAAFAFGLALGAVFFLATLAGDFFFFLAMARFLRLVKDAQN
jgi:hypothetical protein